MRVFNNKLTMIVICCVCVMQMALAQGEFKPRNADEAHAWRLYNQYRESKTKATNLQSGITKKQEDIRTVGNAGMGGTFAIDPQDVAELTKMRQQLAEEKSRQQKLEQAWDKKFWGRYGDLKDSDETMYDQKTKQNIDRIRFRLIYFCNASDGIVHSNHLS